MERFWPLLFGNETAMGEQMAAWIGATISGQNEQDVATLPEALARTVQAGVHVDVVELVANWSFDAGGLNRSYRAPIFPFGLGPPQGAWGASNPFETFTTDSKVEPDDEACRDVFLYASWAAGRRVMGRLRDGIVDGTLILSGAVLTDLHRKSFDLPSARVLEGSLEITGNRLIWSTIALPALVDVRVRAAVQPMRPPSSRSLAAADKPLLEEMDALIAAGDAHSVSEAARKVGYKAVRSGTLDSAEERLRRAYGKRGNGESR